MLTKLDASLLPQAQLQDAKRRWEELQNFLHNVNAEREKLQASKQGEQIEHHTKHLILFNLCYIKNIQQNENEFLFMCGRRAPQPDAGSRDRDEQQEQGDPDPSQQPD